MMDMGQYWPLGVPSRVEKFPERSPLKVTSPVSGHYLNTMFWNFQLKLGAPGAQGELSGRVPTLQAQGLDFDPQCHPTYTKHSPGHTDV